MQTKFTQVFLFFYCLTALATTTDSRYGIPAEQIEKWDKLATTQNLSPQLTLSALIDEKNKLDPGDTLQNLYAEYFIVGMKIELERFPEALTDIKEAILVAESIEYSMYLGDFLVLQAEIFKSLGQYEKALAALQQAGAIFDQHQEQIKVASVYVVRGQIHSRQGLSRLALEDYLRAYPVFKEHNAKEELGTTLSSIAGIYDDSGEYDKAIEYYLESLSVIDVEANKFYASIIYYNMAVTYFRAKNFEQSETYANQALKLSEEIDDTVGKAYAWIYIAKIALQNKLYERAVEFAKNAMDVFEQQQEQMMLLNVHVVLSDSYSALGRFELAKLHLDQAF